MLWPHELWTCGYKVRNLRTNVIQWKGRNLLGGVTEKWECCTIQGLDAWLVLMLHENDGAEETSQVVKIPAKYFLKALWNILARLYHLLHNCESTSGASVIYNILHRHLCSRITNIWNIICKTFQWEKDFVTIHLCNFYISFHGRNGYGVRVLSLSPLSCYNTVLHHHNTFWFKGTHGA